jgi:hypothetical protein
MVGNFPRHGNKLKPTKRGQMSKFLQDATLVDYTVLLACIVVIAIATIVVT